MNLFTSRKGLWRRVNGTLFAKFVNNVYKKVIYADLRLHRKVLRSLPQKISSLTGTFWKHVTAAGRSVHRAIPFSFKSEPFHVPVSAQMWVNLGRILVHKCRECLFFPFWYNPWFILLPKMVHYLAKKMGGLSAARRFSSLFWNYMPFVVNAFWVLPSYIWSEILRSTSWYLSPQRLSSQR